MVSEEFKRNVESGNVISVKSALVDYLIQDPTFTRFDEALKEARKSMNVIDQHDGRPFESDSSKWDDAYLNDVKVALMVNFSEERINHIKRVIPITLGASKTVVPKPIRENETSAKTIGRRVISETEILRNVSPEKKPQEAASKAQNASNPLSSEKNKPEAKSREYSGKSTTRTGRKIVSETVTHIEKSDDDTVSNIMIGSGAAAFAIGAVATLAGGAGGIGYALIAGGAAVICAGTVMHSAHKESDKINNRIAAGGAAAVVAGTVTTMAGVGGIGCVLIAGGAIVEGIGTYNKLK